MKQTIYIADDDQQILDLTSGFLEHEGFSVQTFSNGKDLLEACEGSLPDLVVLDIIMPEMDGLSVCSALRQFSTDLPIIIMSVKSGSYDRVAGLSLGCDDYIIKPFLPLEIAICTRFLLNRKSATESDKDVSDSDAVLCFGPLRLFPNKRSAILNEKPFTLSPTEFDFLSYLIKKDGAAVSREELLKTFWHVNWEANTRVTDDLVKRLRRKFRDAQSSIQIETVWGYGFRIVLGDESK